VRTPEGSTAMRACPRLHAFGGNAEASHLCETKVVVVQAQPLRELDLRQSRAGPELMSKTRAAEPQIHWTRGPYGRIGSVSPLLKPALPSRSFKLLNYQ